MKNIISIIFLMILLSPVTYYSQNNLNTEAQDLTNQAIQIYQEDYDKLEDAIVLLDKAIAIDSNYFLAYSSKCNFLWELKRNQEAFVTAKLATRIENVKSWNILGLAFEHLNKLDSAIVCYKTFLSTYPSQDKGEQIFLLLFVAVVEGKDKALTKLNEIFGEHQKDEFYLNIKNEIEYYQGGGIIEMLYEEGKEYCLKTEKSMLEIVDFLANNGVNAKLLAIKDGYYLFIKDKFRNKAFELGVTECKE